MGKVVIIMVLILSGIFVTIMLTVNSRTEKIPDMLSENYRDLGTYALNFGIKEVVSGDITDSTLVVYDDFHVLDGRIESIEYVFGYGGGDAGYNITGDLNINPSNSSNNLFIMQTPSGVIDRNTLHSEGSSYTYTGSASEIKIKVKAQGRTLIINGESVELHPSIRYTITGDLTVSLRNTHGGHNWNQAKGHWWIQIDATNVTIDPDPGVTVSGSFTDVLIKAEVSWTVNGETRYHDAEAVLEVVTVSGGGTELKLVYWNPW